MRIRLAWVLTTIVVATPGWADHVVDNDRLSERLQEASRQRNVALATVERALGSRDVVRVGAGLGAGLARARAGLAVLSDAELRELAARAEALESDPVAGTSERDVLVVVLIVLIVLLVLKAV